MEIPIYSYNYNFFNQDSEELYYFLGFIAADGYLSWSAPPFPLPQYTRQGKQGEKAVHTLKYQKIHI